MSDTTSVELTLRATVTMDLADARTIVLADTGRALVREVEGLTIYSDAHRPIGVVDDVEVIG